MKISLIGAGPGREGLISSEAKKLIDEADILIGSERTMRSFGRGKTTYNIYKPEEIIAKIKNTGVGKNVAVLFSGDPGFFSGGKKLLNLLDRDEDGDKCDPRDLFHAVFYGESPPHLGEHGP